MKNTLRVIIFAFTFLSLAAFAQTNEIRSFDKFTKIANASSADIYLKQGSPQKVELVGKKELVANVETEVSNGKLKIRIKDNSMHWSWGHNDNLRIYVTVENIDSIELNGSGDLVTQTKIVGNNMELTVNGSGDVEAQMDMAGEMDASVAGSGDIKLAGKFQTLKTHVGGSGDIELSAAVANAAEFDVTGSGDIKATGSAQTMEALVSGSGSLGATNFETDKTKVRVSGSGDAEVFAKVELDARTSGSGDISYRGNPAQLSTHNSGSGSVTKME
jgi:hypothetical protein